MNKYEKVHTLTITKLKRSEEKREEEKQIYLNEKLRNEDMYLVLFEGKLKYPMIFPKEITNISHPFLI